MTYCWLRAMRPSFDRLQESFVQQARRLHGRRRVQGKRNEEAADCRRTLHLVYCWLDRTYQPGDGEKVLEAESDALGTWESQHRIR